jgi:dihydroorotate dehydrogenase
MIGFLYNKLLKPILFQFDPSSVHHLFIKIGATAGKFSPARDLIKALFGEPKLTTPISLDGLTFQGPVLLAAGFDYNGHLASILYSMGFSGEEIGSVTARPCKGNPAPQLRRLIKSKSIQVYKGLKNDGVDAIIKRIKEHEIPEKFVAGVSIARTNDESSADFNQGIQDYCYSFRRLNEENVGSFYTINISCPNAYGGEDFARPEALHVLLFELKKISCSKPIYIKMPIHKSWEEFKELVKIIQQLGYNGVVIGNLNKNYADADFPEEATPQYRGGLSGKPCQKLSTALIQRTREAFPDLTIIGCGGVLSIEDAMEKLAAGANLIQMITGMIFTGPHLINEINTAYAKKFENKGGIVENKENYHRYAH